MLPVASKISCQNWSLVKRANADIHGVLLVDKPIGVTSFDVVRTVGRTLGTRKCGHTGTLDPFASGLLCICIGEATKMVQYLMVDQKEYEAVLILGTETDSCDRDGKVVMESGVPQDIEERMRAALPGFLGTIQQTPPIYSAIKVNGRRLYDYARNGENVEIPSRDVQIEELEILQIEDNRVTLRVRCGKGTYIRALGRDLAKACGTVGHLDSLRRTRLGNWNVADAPQPEEDRDILLKKLMSSQEALAEFPTLEADSGVRQRILWGQRIPSDELPRELPEKTSLIARDESNTLLAVVRLEEGALRIERGFPRPW